MARQGSYSTKWCIGNINSDRINEVLLCWNDIMSNIVKLDNIRKSKDVILKEEIAKSYQNIIEDLVSSMIENGIEFDERTEKATVPLLKIIENIMYTQKGMNHNMSNQVDDFIKNAFK